MTEDNRSIEELAEEALQVQYASNLSGVVHAWSRSISRLWQIAREQGEGTDWVSTHPVNKLFADKCADLSRCRTFDRYVTAHDQCSKLAEGVKDEGN